jgi:hypothetical protein
MVALAALALGLAKPPPAYVEPGHVRLAVSSWCWGPTCGAPIAASGRRVAFRRGATVRVHLAFPAATARVAVGGAPVRVTRNGRDLSWLASRPGGMTISVTGAKGFVTYVGRIAVR